nr:hypothetical protein [Parachlamydiaceae bacterium]
MLNTANQLTCQPCYKKISGFESGIVQAKNILNKHPKALLLTGIALTALGALTIALGAASLLLPPVSLALTLTGAALTAIGISTLLATCFNWKHIAAYMIAIPLLSAVGIQWTSNINPNRFEDRSCSLNGKLIG